MCFPLLWLGTPDQETLLSLLQLEYQITSKGAEGLLQKGFELSPTPITTSALHRALSQQLMSYA